MENPIKKRKGDLGVPGSTPIFGNTHLVMVRDFLDETGKKVDITVVRHSVRAIGQAGSSGAGVFLSSSGTTIPPFLRSVLGG